MMSARYAAFTEFAPWFHNAWVSLTAFDHRLAGTFNTTADLTMVATCAVLLTVTSPRNIHLSDRSRANIDEALYRLAQADGLTPENRQTRLASLEDQTEQFNSRYFRMSIAFMSLVISAAGYVIAAVFGYHVICSTASPCSPGDNLATELNGGLCWLSLIPFVIALALLAVEFYQGPNTLKDNSKSLGIVRQSITKKRSAIIPEQNATVWRENITSVTCLNYNVLFSWAFSILLCIFAIIHLHKFGNKDESS
jgi:hypothetical protein